MKPLFLSVLLIISMNTFALDPKYVGMFKVRTLTTNGDTSYYTKQNWIFEFNDNDTYIMRFDADANGRFSEDEVKAGKCISLLIEGREVLIIDDIQRFIEISWESPFHIGLRKMQLIRKDKLGNIYILVLDEFKI